MKIFKVILDDPRDIRVISKITDGSKIHIVTDCNNKTVVLTDKEDEFLKIKHYDLAQYCSTLLS